MFSFIYQWLFPMKRNSSVSQFPVQQLSEGEEKIERIRAKILDYIELDKYDIECLLEADKQNLKRIFKTYNECARMVNECILHTY